jgi:hypothetical protein
MEELWTQQARKLVEAGTLGGDEKKGLSDIWLKTDSVSFKGIKAVEEDGKIATVSLEFDQPRFDTTLVLDIKMRDKGNHWQLFDITNVFDFVQTINSLEERRVKRINDEAVRSFLEHIQVSKVKVTTSRDGIYSFVSYRHTFSVDFKNISDKVVEDITCIFEIENSSNERLHTGIVKERLQLLPDKIYHYEDVDRLSFDRIDTEGLNVNISLVKVSFDDGSEIKWESEWSDVNKE